MTDKLSPDPWIAKEQLRDVLRKVQAELDSAVGADDIEDHVLEARRLILEIINPYARST